MGKILSSSLSSSSVSIERTDQIGDFLIFSTNHNRKTHRVETSIAVELEDGSIQKITLNVDEVKELQEYLQSDEHAIIMNCDKHEQCEEFYEL